MPIIRAANGEAFSAYEVPEGWFGITPEELAALLESRMVVPGIVSEVEKKKQAVRVMRESVHNRLAGVYLSASIAGDTVGMWCRWGIKYLNFFSPNGNHV